MPTLRDHLAASRAQVTRSEYAASAALDSRQGASWALWGATTGDLSLFQDGRSAAPRLRKDVVLIGANFGLGGDAGYFEPFQNFHASTSGGDTKFRKGLTGTVLEGAFLTDLVKDYPTKYADGLQTEIRTGRFDTERYVATGFRAEQKALGLSPDTLYIPVGRTTRELWDLLVVRGVISSAQRVFHHEYGNGPTFNGKPVLNMTHYSSAVNMVQAVEALLAQRSFS